MTIVQGTARVAVDIGGTFTDLVLLDAGGGLRTAKVPSTPPDYSAGVIEALEQVLEDFRAVEIFVHGTTAPLNAFLERKGAPTALLTTRGFGDVYAMGRGSRYRMYDLHYRNPEPLVPRRLVFEVDERMDEKGRVVRPLDRAALPGILDQLRARGVASVAVCFLHSYVNPAHEERVAEFFAREAPEIFVSPSHQVCREWREYERTSTVVLNAYVSPILGSYLRTLARRFRDRGYERRLYLMQSNGGLIETGEAASRGVLTLMSGPVGGSAGSRALAEQIGEPDLICMDMGGTSFDVSLIVGGQAAVASERRLGDLPVLAPMVDIHTIGAGGGSVAWSESGALRVGPRSAGAVPGPACYGRGGIEPTVTDANLLLGRIDPEGFLGGAMRLHTEKAREAVKRLGRGFHLSAEEMAEGIVKVVDAQMANAIRSVTIGKGIDPRRFALVAFGGAGPMHAASIARELEIGRVIVPQVAGAFSAWGMLTSDLRHDVSQTFIAPLGQIDAEAVEELYRHLESGLDDLLEAEGVPPERRRFFRSLDMRYLGQEYFINVPLREGYDPRRLKAAFDDLYEATYGHKNLAEEVETVNLRVEARGLLSRPPAGAGEETRPARAGAAGDDLRRPVLFGGEASETPFLSRAKLRPGQRRDGPAIVEEPSCTTVVPPGWELAVDRHRNLVLERKS